MNLPKHRYVRQFDTASADSLAQLSEWVPVEATVLELGPAEGYFTRHLKEARRCVIDAVEIDAEMAEKARPWCRDLIVGDLEKMSLTEVFPAQSYDVIILADVLEHLRLPERVLGQLPGLLKPGGAGLVSVPNIAYGGLIAELLDGRFDYRSEGLLDRTHLRFFTQPSLAAMFRETGWHPWEWRSVALPYFESEFRTRLEALPVAFATLLADRPALQCYQWLAQIRPEAPEKPAAVPEKLFSEVFPVRLFWADTEAIFDYACSQVSWGEVGVERQTVRFDLSRHDGDRFRLRLADRPGFVRLYSIEVRATDDTVLWCWASALGCNALGAAMDGMVCADGGAYTLATLQSTESWLDLPWYEGKNCNAETLVVELGWPMSADFAAAKRGWEQTQIPLRSELDAVKSLVASRDRELAARDAAIAARDSSIAAQDAAIVERDVALAGRDAIIVAKDAELRFRGGLIVERDAALAGRDEIIVAKNAELHFREGLIVERDAALAGRDAIIVAKDAELRFREGLIVERDAALAGRDAIIVAKDAELQFRDSLIVERDASIAAHAQTIRILNDELATQRETIAHLQSDINRMRSFSWWLGRTLYWPRRAVQRLRKS